jgi:hypothetical protein
MDLARVIEKCGPELMPSWFQFFDKRAKPWRNALGKGKIEDIRK